MLHNTKKITDVNGKDTPIPTLDLREVKDMSEHREAIQGFLMKHSDKHSVMVVGVNGVVHWLVTAPGKSEWKIKELTTPKIYATSEDEITVTDPSNVAKTFLELTAFTVPYGHEYEMYHTTLTKLGFVLNGRSNYWLTVGDGSSKTLFVAHLDTADKGKPAKVNHLITDDNYVKTDQTTILGADDRAGLAVLLYLASQNIPGDYLLVVGEECGCIGSGVEAPHIEKGKYDRAIQFDRAGTSEIITHQLGKRTASREFARALAKEFRKASSGTIQLQPSDRGVYTDTKEFTDVVRECTNIAIGYESQHTVYELQDLSYLVTIAHAAARINWELLPTKNSYSKPHSYNNWYYDQANLDSDENWDDEPLWDEPTVGYGKKSMWEMWAAIDAGEWGVDDVRKWVIYNPLVAAQIITTYISQNANHSLDVLTTVEMEG